MIAKGQFKNQNDAFEKAKDWVFFDTDLLSLSVYHQHYFNERLSRIPNWKKSPSLTLLLYPDIPWVSEPLRDRPEKREELFELFKAEIEKENRTYLIIKGSDKQRFDSALSAILEWNQHLK